MAARSKSMPTSPLSVVIQHLTANVAPCGGGMTDGELLARFLSGRDDNALAALVRRHAPMVWGVCGRLLHNHHGAEDAFQATFLVLVRKAADVPGQAVANWLYGVARQTAVRMRATAAKRGRRETQVVNMPEPTAAEVRDTDWRSVLDEELSRLPGHYRGVIVLCDLEGMTRREAARQLAIPEGSVASRLARARAMLARRLTRRGVLCSGGSVATVLSAGSASGSAPPALVASTIQAVTLVAAGRTAATGVISAKVAALTEGVITAMLIVRVRGVVALALVACALASGVTALAFGPPVEPKAEPRAGGAKPSGPLEAVAVSRFEGHTEGVYSLAFLPGGKKAVSGGADGTVRFWDLEGGKELNRYEGHEGTVYGLDVSGDGRLLLTGGEDSTMRLWDLETGKEVRRFAGHEGRVRAVAFSADGKQAVSGTVLGDATLRVWDVETGKEVSKYIVAGTPARNRRDIGLFKTGGIGVVPPGGFGAIGFPEETGGIAGVAFSPDGKLGLSGSLDKTVRLWKLPK